MERFPEESALLIAQTGPLNGQRWAVKNTIIIGREPDCDIVVADRQVSRQHAQLRLAPDGVHIKDLGSKNGTFYNGLALQNEMLLNDGDAIQIALTQKFLFMSSDATLPLDGDLYNQSNSPETDLTPPDAPLEAIARLRLDRRSRRVWLSPLPGTAEVEVIPPLSVSQFRLLETLYENQGRVVSRQELAQTVWGEGNAFEVSEQALDALVRRLRERITSIDPQHEYIITVRGHGLRLENPVE